MSLATRAKATAYRLLGKHGQLVLLNHNSAAPYDPSTGKASLVVTSEAVRAVEVEYRISEIDGTLVIRGDKKLFITAVVGSPPAIGDTVTIGGVTMTIKNVDVTSPSGIPILYALQLRK